MAPCLTPVKPEDLTGDNLWLSQHERHLLLARESEPDVIFIGDTILDFFGQSQTWQDLFEPLHCLNFSILGDKIENVLWRIQDGILDSIKPKVVVILTGTNNTNNSPEEISDGILEIVKIVQTKLPAAYIVLSELLPRGKNRNKIWDLFFSTNKLLKQKCSTLKELEYLSHDYPDLITKDEISHVDFFDFLRLTESGHRKVFAPIYEIILQLLNEDEKEKDLSPLE